MNSTVLVVDDSESLRSNTKRMLEQSGLELTVIEASDGAEALPIAVSGEVDIVVSDIVMPRLDGIQLLRAIRQKQNWEELPVILITSMAEEDTRNESFEAGASDYVTRPFSSEEIISRIRVQLRLRQLQYELENAVERYRRLGTHDELTGLANRKQLFEHAQKELSRSRRHKLAMSVVVADIDAFRELSSKAGHLASDALISEMAKVLGRNLRSADVLARLSPQKFGALLPHTGSEQGRAVGERIRAAVRNCAFPSQEAGAITVSVGVATYPLGRAEVVEELVDAAEAALEIARDNGGDRVECAEANEIEQGDFA